MSRANPSKLSSLKGKEKDVRKYFFKNIYIHSTMKTGYT